MAAGHGGWQRGAALVLALALVAAGAARAQPAPEAMVTAAAPASVVQALQAAGFAARLDTTRGRDPLIHAATPGGDPFLVRFYGCLDGGDCRSVQFVAAFAGRPSLEAVNRWNAAMRYGRVHLTEGGRPVLSLDVSLAAGGLTAAQFAARLDLWRQLIDRMPALLAE